MAKEQKKPLGDIVVDAKHYNRSWVTSFKDEKTFIANKVALGLVKHYKEEARQDVLKRIYAEGKKS